MLWPLVTMYCGSYGGHKQSMISNVAWSLVTVNSSGQYALCDLSTVVASVHYKLWRPLIMSKSSLTFKMLWHLAVANCDWLRLQK